MDLPFSGMYFVLCLLNELSLHIDEYFRYRGPSVPASGTLDRAAMIRGDTSSESSGNENFAVNHVLNLSLTINSEIKCFKF